VGSAGGGCLVASGPLGTMAVHAKRREQTSQANSKRSAEQGRGCLEISPSQSGPPSATAVSSVCPKVKVNENVTGRERHSAHDAR
jgi:hypothetical protein